MGHLIRFGAASFDIADPTIDHRPLSMDFLDILRAFVTDTYDSCSYHRQRMDDAGVKPSSIRSFEDFAQIPLLTSPQVSAVSELRLLPDRYQANGKEGLASFAPEDRIAKRFSTTGSTGRPKVSYHTHADWEANLASLGRFMSHIPRASFSRVFNCFHAGHAAGKYTEDAYNRFGCLVENQHPTYTNEEDVIKQLYTGLTELGGFNCLIGPPWRPPTSGGKGTTLDGLLNADVDNYIGRKIRVISMGGAVSDGLRLRERIWEANALANAEKTIINERYGTSEIGMASSDCQYSDGFHIHNGFIYGEVVNKSTGQHVKNGERGTVVFTGLRHGSRYLRYAVGDEGTFVSDPCRCGKTSPRIKNVQRVIDEERLKTGCSSGGY